VSIPVDAITLTIVPSPGVDIEQELRQRSTLRINQTDAPDFATVFGKTFDVGPYVMIVQPSELQISVPDDDPDARMVRIELAQPLLYQFEKFCRDKPNSTD
jgi:hypothetical protein